MAITTTVVDGFQVLAEPNRDLGLCSVLLQGPGSFGLELAGVLSSFIQTKANSGSTAGGADFSSAVSTGPTAAMSGNASKSLDFTFQAALSDLAAGFLNGLGVSLNVQDDHQVTYSFNDPQMSVVDQGALAQLLAEYEPAQNAETADYLPEPQSGYDIWLVNSVLTSGSISVFAESSTGASAGPSGTPGGDGGSASLPAAATVSGSVSAGVNSGGQATATYSGTPPITFGFTTVPLRYSASGGFFFTAEPGLLRQVLNKLHL